MGSQQLYLVSLLFFLGCTQELLLSVVMATKDQEYCGKKLLIIDTDAGVDDAEAILLALSYAEEWQILAITCTHGNTAVDNVCRNVMRVLVIGNNTEIPIYRGCEQSLVWKTPYSTYEGADGLGNAADQFSTGGMKVADVQAVNILTKLVKEYPHQITLLALGPLTSLAMAHRMDPEFTKYLKMLVFMGGNIHGVGNVTPAAEFNFHCDPESAHIILAEASCPILMVPWETTVNSAMEWDLYWKWIKVNTKRGYFIRKITAFIANRLQQQKSKRFIDSDLLAAAALLYPQSIEDSIEHPVLVETTGMYTRGESIVERSIDCKVKSSRKKCIRIVTKFNDELLNELRFKVVEG